MDIYNYMNYKDFFKEVCGLKNTIMPTGIDRQTIKKAVKVEMEHTDNPKIALKIAASHLQEDPQYYSKLQQAGLADELKGNNKGIKEIDVNPKNDLTTPVTTYAKVEMEPNKGPDMAGKIGDTSVIQQSTQPSDVDSPAKDPTPTDHITGGMGGTPSNPNILSKDGCEGNVTKPQFATFDMLKTIGDKGLGAMSKDISIDIAEGKKILNKMIKESFLGKEGYGGDPSTDKKYVPGKRWTLQWNENYQEMGDYQQELALQAIKLVVNQSAGDVDEDMMSIKTYLENQGIDIREDDLERMYREEMDKAGKKFDYTFGRDDGYSDDSHETF